MPKLTAAALLFPLALTACGSTGSTGTAPAPGPSAEVPDDTDDNAQTLVSRTVTLSPAQTRALGITPQATAAPTSPVTVTVAVKIGREGTRYAGQKRAYIGWKLNGKAFPADLTGTTSGTYVLDLKDASGAALVKTKTGTLSVVLPLASGNLNTSRSRSTSYAATGAAACAVASFALALPGGAKVDSGAAPIVVCEPGVVPNVQAPAPAAPAVSPLDAVDLYTWFQPIGGQMSAHASITYVPGMENATVTSRYTLRDAEECGAGDRYGVDGSGEWSEYTGNNPGLFIKNYRLGIDEQSMTQGQGLEYLFTLKLNGKTRELAGVLCYRSIAT